MATVINNPSSTPAVERTVVDTTGETGAGWAVAVIILLAVVAIGGFLWMRAYQAPAAAPASDTGGANINVTLPSTDTGGTNPGGTETPAGGTQQPVTPTPTP